MKYFVLCFYVLLCVPFIYQKYCLLLYFNTNGILTKVMLMMTYTKPLFCLWDFLMRITVHIVIARFKPLFTTSSNIFVVLQSYFFISRNID